MIQINDNFTKLPGNYLFSSIAKKVNAFKSAHPEAALIRLGIGDVTRPLPPASIKAMHRAVDELADAGTFHGYGPEQGYDFLIQAKNYIIRRASNLSKQSHIIAANLNQCMLIVTVNYPETSTTFIDRFLASAEAYRVPVCLVFNKIDRYSDEELHYLEALTNLYTHIGYPCFKISALNQTDIEEIKKELKGKVTLFSGHSGVGKSTLINAILPDQKIKTGEISTVHNKGMHTTTFSEMFPIGEEGYIIDTPGIKGFGTFDMEDEEVGHYFKEIFEFSAKCKYGNCTHRHEPGCAVREAVENHYISESRYASYLNILEDKEEGKYRSAY